jgi:hypothetical protein
MVSVVFMPVKARSAQGVTGGGGVEGLVQRGEPDPTPAQPRDEGQLAKALLERRT